MAILDSEAERERDKERPQTIEDDAPKSHILQIYDPILLKKLFAHALLIDMDDNNEKVDVIKQLLGDDFAELGPGTNRYGALGPDGYCHKIAIDRRGIVDNITEYKRSPELDWISPKVYETNGVVLVAETVELMTKENFLANKANILTICEELSAFYIFTDIGFATKNFCNWGIRRNGDLVILDTGYLIPRHGNEEAMTCPVCGIKHKLDYNSFYTGFVCKRCSTSFSFIDVYRRLNTHHDDAVFAQMNGFELPDFSQLNNMLYQQRGGAMMKGGHLHYDPDEQARRQRAVGSEVRYEDILDIIRAQEESGHV